MARDLTPEMKEVSNFQEINNEVNGRLKPEADDQIADTNERVDNGVEIANIISSLSYTLDETHQAKRTATSDHAGDTDRVIGEQEVEEHKVTSFADGIANDLTARDDKEQQHRETTAGAITFSNAGKFDIEVIEKYLSASEDAQNQLKEYYKNTHEIDEDMKQEDNVNCNRLREACNNISD